MKFMHISDLHLGKSLHGASLIDDQEYILKQLLGFVISHRPDAVVICGDVFDQSVAPVDALRLFEEFLDGLVQERCEVFIIAGNHDSADRLSFNSRLLEVSGVHIAKNYDGVSKSFILNDEHGPVFVYLLPFVKPATVRRYFPESMIETWTDALKAVIDVMDIDKGARNILLAHQFVTGSVLSGSEELAIGGADNVDADVFIDFDYVALGHLHRAQSVSRPSLRYSGTPLAYSFSEAGGGKSATLCEMKGKGVLDIQEIPLIPLRQMREIRCSYHEAASRTFYMNQKTDDYLRIILTDEDDQPDALFKLRTIYENLLRVDYDNTRTRTADTAVSSASDEEGATPLEMIQTLYAMQNGSEMTGAQEDYMRQLIDSVSGGVYETS